MIMPPLVLDKEQTKRLLAYLQEYRRYTLTQQMPSPERNTTQRLLQAIQGRLIHESEREQQPSLSFPLTVEERRALKCMITDLCVLKANGTRTDHTYAALLDLTELKGMLEQHFPSERTRPDTQHLL